MRVRVPFDRAIPKAKDEPDQTLPLYCIQESQRDNFYLYWPQAVKVSLSGPSLNQGGLRRSRILHAYKLTNDIISTRVQ